MKAKGGMLAGFVTVFGSALIIVATCCLCLQVSEAACNAGACQANCYPKLRGCTSGEGPVCKNNTEPCNTCACPTAQNDRGECNCYGA